MYLLRSKQITKEDVSSILKEEVITNDEWRKRLGNNYKYLLKTCNENESLKKLFKQYLITKINGIEIALNIEDVQRILYMENYDQNATFRIIENKKYPLYHLEKKNPGYMVLLRDKIITAKEVEEVTEGILAEEYRDWKKEHLVKLKERLVFVSID